MQQIDSFDLQCLYSTTPGKLFFFTTAQRFFYYFIFTGAKNIQAIEIGCIFLVPVKIKETFLSSKRHGSVW